MAVSVRLSEVKCLQETDEASASDEIYVVVTVVRRDALNLGGLLSIPSVETHLYGPWGKIDKGNTRRPANDDVCFPPDPQARDTFDPDWSLFLVAVMEQDNGDAEQLAQLVNSFVTGDVFGSFADNITPGTFRKNVLRSFKSALRTARSAAGIEFPFNFDDILGAAQIVPIEHVDVIFVERDDGTLPPEALDAASRKQMTFQFPEKLIYYPAINAVDKYREDGKYRLTFRIERVPGEPTLPS